MIDTLINLFVAFLKVGSLSFGGAYSLIPIIEKEIVNNHHWLDSEEFLKVLGMAEIFPGAISIKFATYTGYKSAGILAALVILLAYHFYSYFQDNRYVVKAFKGIKFIVIGMILAIMYQYTLKTGNSMKGYFLLAAGAALIILFKINPAFVVVIGAVLGMLFL
ncbi:MAG: chromate transporter [Ignavibacteriales bacterium]|nr:chromate transporter [Ignavibacteriales bacterium]